MHIANLAGEPQQLLTLRAAHILVFFAVFQHIPFLGKPGADFIAPHQIFVILRVTLHIIAGKHAENRKNVQYQANRAENSEAENHSENIEGKPGNQCKHSQLIGPVASYHKASEHRFDFFPKRHRISFLSVIPSVEYHRIINSV